MTLPGDGEDPESHLVLRPLGRQLISQIQMSSFAKLLIGPLEEYSVHRSRLGIYLNVCVTASYAYRQGPTGHLKPRLYDALKTVISTHPILGAIPVNNNDGELVFGKLKQINLDKVVSLQVLSEPDTALRQGGLNRELEDQHRRGFSDGSNKSSSSSSSPFWRMKVFYDPEDYSNFVVIFCFHHSLMDTKSALIFLEDLETALTDGTSEPTDNLVTTSTQDINPPLHSVLDLASSPSFLEKQITQGEPPPHIWSGAPQSPPCSTNVSTIWLSVEQTSHLQHQCKSHGTTLTALIMSIMARSCFEALDPEEYTVLYGDCAVSLLRFADVNLDARSMGCYVTAFSAEYDRDSSDVWDEAKRTKTVINEVLSRKGSDSAASYLHHVPDINHWLQAKLGKRRWSAWELSNVGTVTKRDENDHAAYSIKSVLFSQSASATGPAVKVSVASGRDGKLSLAFSYQEGIVSLQDIDCILRNVEAFLSDIGGSR